MQAEIGRVRLRLLPNRNRLELRIGHATAELCADDLAALQRCLPAAMASLGGGWAAAHTATGPAAQMLERLAALLATYVAARLPLPSNEELAARLGIADSDRIRRGLRALERDGRLTITQRPGGPRMGRMPGFGGPGEVPAATCRP